MPPRPPRSRTLSALALTLTLFGTGAG
ncbi:hypothetical protein GA0115251_10761, partial [Streptomyces sp. TverLS-915]